MPISTTATTLTIAGLEPAITSIIFNEGQSTEQEIDFTAFVDSLSDCNDELTMSVSGAAGDLIREASKVNDMQFLTGNNGRDFPPQPAEWVGYNERYGYFDCMYIGVDTPNGYEVGTIATTTTGDTWSIGGDTAGLSIDSATGMITISDTSLITVEETRQVSITRAVAGQATPDTVTLPIYVVTDTTSVAFFSPDGDDSNDGRQPHKPRQTLADAIDYNKRRDKMLFLRGATFYGCLPVRGDRMYASYGNPLNGSPKIVYSDVTATTTGLSYDSCIHSQMKSDDSGFIGIDNLIVKDFILDGNEDCIVLFEATQVGNYDFNRIHLQNNGNDANASGIRGVDNKDGGSVRLCTTGNNSVYGDGIYFTRQKTTTALYEYAYNELGYPLGGAADCLQITDENQAVQTCYNVWVHHNITNNGVESSSTKGAMVIQGCVNALVEHNEIEGKYFGLGFGFKKGVARRNYIRRGGLPRTNGNWFNTWGIGCGADDALHSCSIYDNNIVARYDVNDTDFLYYGLIIGGFNLTGLDAERYDFEYTYNKTDKCAQFFKANGGISWSGILANNLTDNNFKGDGTANTTHVEDNAGLATQGTYLDKTIEQPHIGIFDSQSTVTVYGATDELDTLTAVIDLVAGETIVSRQWRLNGLDISGATSETYTIPAGTSAQTYDRMPQVSPFNIPEISCVITVQNSSGKRDFVFTDYYRVGEEYSDLLTEVPNQAPTASAGSNATVAAGGQTQIGGIDTDTDGTIASILWTVPSGKGSLSDATIAQPTYTAHSPSAQEVVTLTKTVTDDDGSTGVSTVQITVQAAVTTVTTKRATFDIPTLARNKANTRWYVFSTTELLASGISTGFGPTFEVDLDNVSSTTSNLDIVMFATNRFATNDGETFGMSDLQPVTVTVTQ